LAAAQRRPCRREPIAALCLDAAGDLVQSDRKAIQGDPAMKKQFAVLVLSTVCFWPFLSAAQSSNRVTILYDAFGKSPELAKDRGFSALLEYGGRRILFDLGNNAEHFAHNVKALKADLRKLDFVVVSHRHADHTSGLNYLLTVNPDVKIYVPDEPSGYFGAKWRSKEFYRRDESLPAHRCDTSTAIRRRSCPTGVPGHAPISSRSAP